jgi:hypothetical protein
MVPAKSAVILITFLIKRKEQSEMPRHTFDVILEVAIVHAITSAQQAMQKEAPSMDQLEISLGKLSALAHVTAQEIAAIEQLESKSAVTSFPAGPGTHFMIELQEELQQLYRTKE